jgi:hypothetical protein
VDGAKEDRALKVNGHIRQLVRTIVESLKPVLKGVRLKYSKVALRRTLSHI